METNTFDNDGGSSHFPPAGASPAVRAIIREFDALRRDGSTGYSAAEVADAARRICAAARSEHLYIEQAIVNVKEAWRSTPGRLKPRQGNSDATLDLLVSACIREFYSER